MMGSQDIFFVFSFVLVFGGDNAAGVFFFF